MKQDRDHLKYYVNPEIPVGLRQQLAQARNREKQLKSTIRLFIDYVTDKGLEPSFIRQARNQAKGA